MDFGYLCATCSEADTQSRLDHRQGPSHGLHQIERGRIVDVIE